jgi:sec-independent protein translocase protein TatC
VTAFAVQSVTYVVSSPFQVLSLSFDIGLALALVATFPLLLTEFLEFIWAGLTKRERKNVLLGILVSLALFLVGFAYGAAVMYYAVTVAGRLTGSLGLVNYWDIDAYFSQILITAACLGLVFEYPLVLYALVRSGVLAWETLAGHRRFVIAASVVLVALLPPTDGLSLIVMSAPIIGLFELSLLASRPRLPKTAVAGGYGASLAS